MRNLIVLFCFYLFSSSAQAGTPAEDAFEKIKGLAGTWNVVGTSDNVSFEVISGGSALVERGEDMITVYHLDGNSVRLTHYCDAGNQPRLRASRFASPLTGLRFDFVDVTNLKPGKVYINGLDIAWLEDGTVRETWSDHKSDGQDESFSFRLHRVQGSTR
jgi:hypothetical protein